MVSPEIDISPISRPRLFSGFSGKRMFPEATDDRGGTIVCAENRLFYLYPRFEEKG